MEFKPGLYPGISRREYGSIQAVNHSILKHFRKSAAHARQEILSPSEPTADQIFGTRLHLCCLEPEKFESDFLVAPKVDKRTKEGKAAWAAFEQKAQGKEIIDLEDRDKILSMRDSILGHETANTLMTSPGKNEMCVLWNDPAAGVACKSLTDRFTTYGGSTAIVDIKTCKDAGGWAFGYDINKFGYHSQAAFYLEGPNVLAPLPRRFMFIAVEKTKPYGVAVYELDRDSIEMGGVLFRRWLNQYSRCVQTGRWDGYPEEIQSIRIPKFGIQLRGDDDGFTGFDSTEGE